MGKTRTVSFEELERAIKQDIAELAGRLEGAIDETVEDSVGIVWGHVPFAFGELHGSVHVEGRSVVADAPHAAAVEVGSMPHMPPVEPLVAWASMRGFSDPESAAWGIAIKISKEGTKPTWYMRNSLPEMREKLDRNMKQAVK